MKILRNTNDLNFIINTESDFLSDLGSEENLQQFEAEVLNEIINPLENYETIRFIHEPYSVSGYSQCDILFYFHFYNNNTNTYVQDYTPVGISPQENELLLRQTTDSFFSLEFYKTPNIVDIDGNIIGYELPNRTNRKLVFTKNLSIPLGEKFYYETLNGYIHIPIFVGTNYTNKENMYLFWFEDESVLTETNLSGSTNNNTFYMTAKFYDAKTGDILDFVNQSFSTTHEIQEQQDVYFKVDIDKVLHTYKIYDMDGNRVGTTNLPIHFYEKGGINMSLSPTPTPSATPNLTQIPYPTPTPTPSNGNTIQTEWYKILNCWDGTTGYTQSSIDLGVKYKVNDRLETFPFNGQIWVVTNIVTTNPGGSQILVVSAGHDIYGNNYQFCPPIITYYLTDGYLASPEPPDTAATAKFCTSPGKITGTILKSLAPTIIDLINYPISDENGNQFPGLGVDYVYAITTLPNQNTYTLGNFYMITIDTNGSVKNLETWTCGGGGGNV